MKLSKLLKEDISHFWLLTSGNTFLLIDSINNYKYGTIVNTILYDERNTFYHLYGQSLSDEKKRLITSEVFSTYVVKDWSNICSDSGEELDFDSALCSHLLYRNYKIINTIMREGAMVQLRREEELKVSDDVLQILFKNL